MPGSAEYGLGGWWQGRREIGHLLEVISSGRREALVDALMEALRAYGARLAILSPEEEERALGFYRDRGWEPLEEVLVYRRNASPLPAVAGGLDLRAADRRPAAGPDGGGGGRLSLDVALRPRLFRRGRRDAAAGGCAWPWTARAWPVTISSRCITISATWTGWRCIRPTRDEATAPRCWPGRWASCRPWAAASRGSAPRRDNRVSQRLYEAFGFRRTGSYRIYGKWLAQPGPEPDTARRAAGGPL